MHMTPCVCDEQGRTAVVSSKAILSVSSCKAKFPYLQEMALNNQRWRRRFRCCVRRLESLEAPPGFSVPSRCTKKLLDLLTHAGNAISLEAPQEPLRAVQKHLQRRLGVAIGVESPNVDQVARVTDPLLRQRSPIPILRQEAVQLQRRYGKLRLRQARRHLLDAALIPRPRLAQMKQERLLRLENAIHHGSVVVNVLEALEAVDELKLLHQLNVATKVALDTTDRLRLVRT
eukprot:scaffold451_cov208-Pinguiococcus_pyrenoidosus.AAC.7